MITAASLKAYTVKDLAQMARKRGVSGWHSMRKEQLVKALLRAAKAPAAKSGGNSSGGNSSGGNSSGKGGNGSSRSKSASRPKASRKSGGSAKPSGSSAGGNGRARSSSMSGSAAATASSHSTKVSKLTRHLQQTNEKQERLKDLTTPVVKKKSSKKRRVKPIQPIIVERDRIVLLVRDPYWLHACWELSRQNVERAKAAMAEHWHTAKPVLRLYHVETGTVTSATTQWVRDIPIHGGVRNWYIDVLDPPQSYLVDIGYISPNGKFFTLARSNTVTTPRPGSCDTLDENWAEVAENYERVYSQSGGNDETSNGGELQELFEERLRRPMGAPLVTRYGSGANVGARLDRNFEFDVDAELIIYGTTKPNAHVTLAGEPVKLRADGTFTVRQSMPNKRQVLPLVADSRDGVEQRTIVLAVERNTKVMEPVIREANDV